MRMGLALIAATAFGAVYWRLASQRLGVAEPWDGKGFVLYYLGALAISLLAGLIVGGHRSWMIGAVVVFTMLPVMIVNSGVGSLFLVGFLFVGVLAAPAGAASLLGSRIRKRLINAHNLSNIDR